MKNTRRKRQRKQKGGVSFIRMKLTDSMRRFKGLKGLNFSSKIKQSPWSFFKNRSANEKVQQRDGKMTEKASQVTNPIINVEKSGLPADSPADPPADSPADSPAGPPANPPAGPPANPPAGPSAGEVRGPAPVGPAPVGPAPVGPDRRVGGRRRVTRGRRRVTRGRRHVKRRSKRIKNRTNCTSR